MPAASPVTVPVLAGASELSAVEVRFDGEIRGFSPSDTFETVLCKFGIDTRLFPKLRVMPNGGARLQVNLEVVLASCGTSKLDIDDGPAPDASPPCALPCYSSRLVGGLVGGGKRSESSATTKSAPALTPAAAGDAPLPSIKESRGEPGGERLVCCAVQELAPIS